MSQSVSQCPASADLPPGQAKRHCHPHIHHATVASLIFLLAITSIGLLLLGVRNDVLLIVAGSLQLAACLVMAFAMVKSNAKVYRGALISYAACILIGFGDIIRIAIVGPEPIARNPVSHSGFGDVNGGGGMGKHVDDATRGPWVASMVVNGAVLAIQAAVVFVLYRHYDVLVRKFVEKKQQTLERSSGSPYGVVVQASER